MSTYMQWFPADQITVAGYAGGERTSDAQPVADGNLAVEIEGPHDVGAIFQGSKTELLRFATDIIEATLIAEARSKDREMRLAALQSAELRVEQLQQQPGTFTVSAEHARAIKAGMVGGLSIGNADLRVEALRRNDIVGKYTYAELEAMPMDDYLAACADLLGIEPDQP